MFYVPDAGALELVPAVYTIQKQFPEVHFTYALGPELKGKLE